ncbi:MAG: dienelactone hydrolase family protein [Proteobacteria bacterium]|nr:dienelactone hydrolase family protein [Pseudomonadota bacterium]
MLSLFDNKYYKSAGNPRKLVIFIHGYNGSPEAIDYAVQGLRAQLKDAVIVVPRAPFACEKNGDNLQWLSFYKEDPEVRFRHPDASVEEIYDIFDRLGGDFAEAAAQMNAFIDEQQKIWSIDDAHTYIMGFSQGAMISIYTALTRRTAVAGCIAVAGIVPGKSRLGKEIVSKPPFLLLHGRDDATVQYKTVPATESWFQNQGLNFQLHEFNDLAHRMNEAEMQKAADFINS